MLVTFVYSCSHACFPQTDSHLYHERECAHMSSGQPRTAGALASARKKMPTRPAYPRGRYIGAHGSTSEVEEKGHSSRIEAVLIRLVEARVRAEERFVRSPPSFLLCTCRDTV